MLSSADTMPLQMAKEIIDIAGGLNTQKIILIGGEPTIHEHFFEIIGHNKEIEFTLVTNGIAFANKSFCQRAEESGLSRVSTSLKGASEEEYEKWSGKRMFGKVMQAIGNLENSGMQHQVSITVCRPLVEQWRPTVEVIKNCGANHFIFSFERPVIHQHGITFDDSFMPSDVARFIEDEMYPSLKENGISFDVNLTFPQCHFSEGFIDKMRADGHAVAGCQLLMNNGIIFDPNGRVIPCNHMIYHPLGEYRKDFFTSDELREWRESSQIQRFYDIACAPPILRCKECPKWTSCGAGCRIFWLYQGADKLLPTTQRQKGGDKDGNRILAGKVCVESSPATEGAGQVRRHFKRQNLQLQGIRPEDP
jgi:radical SAM protein with 4Fe4S-binding SPASM domain